MTWRASGFSYGSQMVSFNFNICDGRNSTLLEKYPAPSFPPAMSFDLNCSRGLYPVNRHPSPSYCARVSVASHFTIHEAAPFLLRDGLEAQPRLLLTQTLLYLLSSPLPMLFRWAQSTGRSVRQPAVSLGFLYSSLLPPHDVSQMINLNDNHLS